MHKKNIIILLHIRGLRKIISSFIFAVLLLANLVGNAATITSTGSGAWSSTTINAPWPGGAVPAVGDNVIIANGSTVTITANLTQTGSVTVNTGGTIATSGGTISFGALTINASAVVTMYRQFTVTATTNITGTINFGSTSGTVRAMTFTGDVTLNTGAVWNETTTGAAATFSFGGNLTNNATTFTAQNTAHNFTGATKIISGSTAFVIPTITFTGNYTNNGTLTCATLLTVTGGAIRLTNNGTITATTSLAGTGGVTQGAAGVLNIGGTSGITTLTATNVGNIVNYNGVAQTVKPTTYHHLNLSGSGIKTLAGITTLNGNLTMSGTSTATCFFTTITGNVSLLGTANTLTTGANLVISGTLNIGDGCTFNAAGFNLTVNGATTIGAGTSGVLFISNAAGTKTFSDIIVNGTWTNSINEAITLTGNLTVNSGATFTAGTAAYTFTGVSKSITGTIATLSIPSITVSTTGRLTNNISGLTVGTLLTITSPGTFTNGVSMTVTASTALSGTGSFIQGINSVLNLAGTTGISTLTATATGNTVDYTGTGAQTIKTTNYYNLSLSGSNTKTMAANLTILKDLSINSALSTAVAGYSLIVGGNWTNIGTFNVTLGGTPAVTFNGTADQTITNAAGESYCILNISKTSGILYLANNVSVNQNTGYTFSLNGIVNCQNNTLSLGKAGAPNNAGTLTYTDGRIIGNFERWLPNTSLSYLFPVGNTDNYTPLNITFNTISAQGSVIAKFVGSDPGSNGFNVNDGGTLLYNPFVDGYWDLATANGFAASSFDMQLTGNGFTAFTVTSETRLLTRANSSSAWTANGTHVSATGFTAKRITLTTISGQYCFGDNTPCTKPSVPTITSSDIDLCTSSSGAYQVTNNSPNTYVWSIYPPTAGTFNPSPASGDYQVTVDWGVTGQIAYVICKERNTCTFSTPDSITVNINSIAPVLITGNENVSVDALGESYSVTNVTGYTYAWSITGGTQASGTNTSSITVDWDSNAGAGQVSVIAQKTGCSAASATVLNVIKYGVISSNGTGGGFWNTNSTWDCNCRPPTSSSVRILAGDLVTQTNNSAITIKNLMIDGDGVTDGTFRGGNRSITVTGDINIDGILEINNNRSLILTGINSTISGIGRIQSNVTGGDVRIQSGDKTILPSTNLTIVAAVAGAGRLDILTTGVSVTNNGIISIEGDINPSVTTGTIWTNAANSTLKIGGAIAANLTLYASELDNTVEYSSTAAQAILQPFSSTYYNLTCSGSGIKTVPASLILDGNVTISGTASLDVSITNYSLSIGGSWDNSSAAADPFVQRSGTVTFNGTVAQSITGVETFFNLVVNNSVETITLNNSVSVTNRLTMTSGDINAGVNRLVLGTSVPFEGILSYTSGTIIGEFQRYLTSTGSKLFPIGVAGNYRPISLNINTLSTAGSLITKFVESDPGSTGLPLTESTVNITNQFADGYWNVTAANGFASSNYNINLTGTGFIGYTISSATRIIKRTNAGSWVLDGTHSNAIGAACYRNALTGGISSVGTGSQFALGVTDCPTFITSAIAGNTDVCSNAAGEVYSVTDNGRTYTWSIPGSLGTIISGQGTASVTVNWNGTASPAEIVQVVENSICFTAPAVTINVALHTNVTSAISGLTSVAENTTQGPYTVTARPGYTYTWSVPTGNGAISAGNGTNSVTITWGAASNATLRVVGQSGFCPTAPNTDLAVTVYTPIASAQNGNWFTGTTWVGGVVPSSIQNIKILHTVTISDASKTINNITIEPSGTLTHNPAFNLTVNGTYLNNGTHNLGNNTLILNSTAAGVFSGTNGTLNSVGGLQFNTNNFTIPTGTILTINNTGAITIASNLTVTNNGTISVSGNINGGNSSSTWLNNTNATLKIGGALLSTGVLNASATGNTVEYNGTTSQNIKSPSSNIYYNLTLSDPSGSSTKSMQSSLYCDNNLTIAGTAALDAVSNYNLYIRGNWNVTSTNSNPFVERSATVFFDGSATQVINTVLVAGETFNTLSCSGLGEKQLANKIIINANFSNSGSFNAGSNSVELKGNWSNSGTFTTLAANTVIFSGTTIISGSSENSFKNINVSGIVTAPATNMNIAGNVTNNGTFNHNNGTITFNGTSIVSGSSTFGLNNVLISGALTASSSTMSVNGSFTNNGTFTHNSGTVLFPGTTAILGSSSSSFNNITISGTLTAPATNFTISGNFANNGTFSHNSGTIICDNSTNITGSSSIVFNNANITGSALIGLNNFTVLGLTDITGTVVISNNAGTKQFGDIQIGSVGSLLNTINSNATINGNIVINGTFTPGSGTYTFAGTGKTLSGSSNFANLNGNITGTYTYSCVLVSSFNSLTIAGGAQLTIAKDCGLTINTDLNSSGTIYVDAGPKGHSGSLLITPSSVTALGTGTFKTSITKNVWHGVSSPVTNAQIETVFSDLSLQANNFYKYVEIDTTVYWVRQLTGAMTPGIGFYTYYFGNKYKTYSGVFNNGNITVSPTYTASGRQGWYFVGNPYQCAIDWDASGWTKTNLDNAVYIKNGSGWDTYISGVGSARYIYPGQGFFVKANAAATLGFSNTIKLHRLTDTLKSIHSDLTVLDPIIHLSMNTDSTKNSTYIRFTENATPVFDKNWDAFKIFSEKPLYPELFSVSTAADSLSINSTPFTGLDTIIPLGIKVGAQGNYRIKAEELLNFDLNTDVFLEDAQTSTWTNLKQDNQYTFSSGPYRGINRFFLHFIRMGTDVKKFAEVKSLSVTNPYDCGGSICFVVHNYLKSDVTIELVDVNGKVLYNETSRMNNTSQFYSVEYPSLQSGYYFLKVYNPANIVAKKVCIIR